MTSLLISLMISESEPYPRLPTQLTWYVLRYAAASGGCAYFRRFEQHSVISDPVDVSRFGRRLRPSSERSPIQSIKD